MRWTRSLFVQLLAAWLLGLIAAVSVLYVGGDIGVPGLLIGAAAGLAPIAFWARRLTQRVAAMTEFSHAVAAGGPPPHLAAAGGDDLGRLQANVVAMAQGLRAQLESVRQEQGKLQATLSGMVEGVIVLDRNGVIQLSNEAAQRILGSPLPLAGRALIGVSRDPDLHALLRAAIQAADQEPLVHEIVLQADRRRSLRVTAAPLAQPGAGAPHIILVFHDITELKKLEAARRDFVANVSHELRTPLTAIRGYAETLLSGALDDPQVARNFVAVIERHSERLTRLTDDLLTLSDLELGRAALQPEAMALAPCVDAVLEVMRDKAAQRNVGLRCEVPDDLPPLLADADRLEQVLLNLLDNAVKYTAAGGSVTVAARCVPSDTGSAAATNRWIEIVVSDTGTGIPREDLPRLTERFYRVDKARSRELGGTGLGLAIVKHIVQAHGGTLQIDSELGRGTRATVRMRAEG